MIPVRAFIYIYTEYSYNIAVLKKFILRMLVFDQFEC